MHIPIILDGELEQLILDVIFMGIPFRRKRAGVPPTYAGQVLKEYLKSQEVDTDVFDKKKDQVLSCSTHHQIKHSA